MMSASLLISLCLLAAQGYYISGTTARVFTDKDRVWIRVNSLRSLSAVVPFDYYALPFCRPAKIEIQSENIGELMWGDKIQSSPYSPVMRQNVSCQKVPCSADNYLEVAKNIDKLEEFINKGYRGYMSINGLPVYLASSIFPGPNVRCKEKVPTEQSTANQRGYALGVHKNCLGSALINNHLHFRIEYNEIEPGKFIVVGFTAIPVSVRHANDGGDCTTLFNYADANNPTLSVDDVRRGSRVTWSYSVSWVENPNVRWATRWDAYLGSSVADSNARSHWIFIAVAIVMTLCLCTIASAILMRTLHKDFNRYNSTDPDENQEEIGWKLVHADVFRAPSHSHWLSAFVGTGVQLLLMITATLVLALLGFLSPASRGQLLAALLIFYVVFSFVSGYTCGLLLKMFDPDGGKQWGPVFVCATFFSGLMLVVYFVIDVTDASLGASNASAEVMVKMIVMWIVSSIPLCVLGAGSAFRQEAISHPVRIGRLAREIPEQRYWIRPPWVYVLSPMFAQCTLLLEMDFILEALWGGAVYYVFGFLAMVFVLWAVVAALTAIIVVYFTLAYENHRWWWAAGLAPGGGGAHLMAYFIYFYITNLAIGSGVASMIYFLTMGIVAMAYALAAGAVGLIAGLIFVRKIFSAIKID